MICKFFCRLLNPKDKKEPSSGPKINDFWSQNDEDHLFKFENFHLWNDSRTTKILDNINVKFKKNFVISIIGPSGSGKTTLLKCLNKSIFDDGYYVAEGGLSYKNIDILKEKFPIEILRTQIGLVFQKPIMFPMSIRDNVLFALKAHGVHNKAYLDKKLESLLRNCFLWDELKDRLDEYPDKKLSGGQQQRLCIARALALQPSVLLMDEPTSSLDPKSNSKIEQLIIKIAKKTTVILVSHSLSQVRRVSDYTLFLKNGKVLEFDTTRKIFTNPAKKETKDYVSSKY